MRYLKVRLSPVSADEPKRFYSMLPVYQPWKSLASSKFMPTRSMRTFTRSTFYGATAVYRLAQGGAPQQINPAQLGEVWRLVELPPYALGFPYGRWSLSKLRSYLIKYKIVSNI